MIRLTSSSSMNSIAWKGQSVLQMRQPEQRSSSTVATTGSISGIVTWGLGGPYTMSKHAVEAYTDLKRHDMGEGLKEDFQGATEQQNREFTTARLWGVADTAPYLHDGRAARVIDVLTTHNREGRHGKVTDLSAGGLDDLVAYVLTR